jgi:glycosyltransferase involved in cell wall biosynthesis
MKFTIIIPIYNAEKYLEQALKSVVNQTYSDWELICINDGSTDSSAQIVDRFSKTDNRILTVNQQNSGQGIARNRGIELASGDYILFLDADDWLEINTLETLNKIIEQNSADLVIFEKDEYFEDTAQFVRRDMLRISEAASKIKLLKTKPFAIETHRNYTAKELYSTFFYSIPYTWDKAYSRNFLITNNIRYEQGKLSEDTGFYLQTMLLAKNIVYSDKYLYHYRNHSTNITKTASEKHFSIFFRIKTIRNLLEKHSVQNALYANYQYFALWLCCTSFSATSGKEGIKFVNEARKVLNTKYFLFFIIYIFRNRLF